MLFCKDISLKNNIQRKLSYDDRLIDMTELSADADLYHNDLHRRVTSRGQQKLLKLWVFH